MTVRPDRIALSTAGGQVKGIAAAASLAVHAGLAGAVLLWETSFVPPRPPAVLTVDLVIETAAPESGRPGPEERSAAPAAAANAAARPAPDNSLPVASTAAPVEPPPTPPAKGPVDAAAGEAAVPPAAKASFAPPPKARPPRKPVIQPRTVTGSLGDKAQPEQEARLPDAGAPSAGMSGGGSSASSARVSSVEPVAPPTFAAPGRGNPAPRYPSAARRRGLEGRLVLRVAVDRTGKPDRLTLVESSGHALLDEAAIAAVSRWRFTPGRRGGATVAATVDVPIVFRLQASR